MVETVLFSKSGHHKVLMIFPELNAIRMMHPNLGMQNCEKKDD